MTRRCLALVAVSAFVLASLSTACGRYGPPERMNDREEAAAEAADTALEEESEEEESR